MILYGRYLSPFARRVGVWMHLQGRTFEHLPLPARGPGSEGLVEVNPMLRIPALRLDDGTVLIESFAIIDWLEETAPAGRRLLPPSGVERMRRLQGVALANTLAEKAVALSAERIRRPKELHWPDEIARVDMQVAKALEIAEAHTPESGFTGAGGAPDGATVAIVTAYDFTAKVFPEHGGRRYPRLSALSERANALPAFGATRP
jgi:glutathione S-transferase